MNTLTPRNVPTILRDLTEDRVPKPQYPTVKMSSYVLHDLTCRPNEKEPEGGFTRRNGDSSAASRNQDQLATFSHWQDKARRIASCKQLHLLPETKDVYSTTVLKLQATYPYLFDKRPRVIDVAKLKHDPRYHAYFLMPGEDKSRVPLRKLRSRRAKVSYFITRLLSAGSKLQLPNPTQSTQSIVAEPKVIIKKPKDPKQQHKQPKLLIQRYSRNQYDPTRAQTEYVITKDLHDQRLDQVHTRSMAQYRNREQQPTVHYRAFLAESADPKTVLECASPGRMGLTTSKAMAELASRTLPHDSPTNAEREQAVPDLDVREADHEQRRLEKYGSKDLSEFVVPEKLREPCDIASAYNHIVSWRLAQLHKLLKQDGHSAPRIAQAADAINLQAINEQVMNGLMPRLEVQPESSRDRRTATSPARLLARTSSAQAGIRVEQSANNHGSSLVEHTSVLEPSPDLNTEYELKYVKSFTSRDSGAKTEQTTSTRGTARAAPASGVHTQHVRKVQHIAGRRHNTLPTDLIAMAANIKEMKQKYRRNKPLFDKCRADLDAKFLRETAKVPWRDFVKSLASKSSSHIQTSKFRSALAAAQKALAAGHFDYFRRPQCEKLKVHVKPPLDTTPYSFEARFGSPGARERIDAFLSSNFYRESNKTAHKSVRMRYSRK